MRDARELDLILLGATGFVGRLTAGYLAEHAPAGLRVGLAGRSQERLAKVRDGLGTTARTWPLIATDPTDRGRAQSLARMAGAIATTVGPYRRLGLPLAQACAEAGTDYADLTGEVLFIKDTMASCQQAAARTGARIVHSCGFDSIPSDLGVLLTHSTAASDDAGDLEDTTLVLTAMRGGVSGGTLASALGQIDDMRASISDRRIVTDPYALSPDRDAEPDLGDERDLAGIRYDPGLRLWTGPFVMASFNTRIVRRSNALQGWAYGRKFRYREVTGFGAGPGAPVRALAVTAGLAALMAGVTLPPSRALLGPVLPKPGEGPGEKARRAGFYRLQVHARTATGARYRTCVEARGDPGYAATSVMLGESALCLALDRERLPDRAGVLTPATAMGAVLTDRLRAAGHTFEAARISEP
ncbi:MAG TPA: saccharopine dehydrogenase NADP-binding domain-containing protein [Streptosporangiaceae bacterium]